MPNFRLTLRQKLTTENARQGNSAIELVLVFPTFLLMYAALFWLGGTLLRKSQVTIDARLAADDLRVNHGPVQNAEPYDFTPGTGANHVRKELSFSIFPRVFPRRTPAALHLVTLGSWDHRQLKKERAPDYRQASKLAAQGPQAALAAKSRGIESFLNDFSIGGLIANQQNFFSLSAENLGGITGAVASMRRTPNQSSGDPQINQAAQLAGQLYQAKIQEILSSTGELGQVLAAVGSFRSQANQDISAKKQQLRDSQQDAEKLVQWADEAKRKLQEAQVIIGQLRQLRDAAEPEVGEKLIRVSAALDRLADIHDRADQVLDKANRSVKNAAGQTVSASALRKMLEIAGSGGSLPASSAAIRQLPDRVTASGYAGAANQFREVKRELENFGLDLAEKKEKARKEKEEKEKEAGEEGGDEDDQKEEGDDPQDVERLRKWVDDIEQAVEFTLKTGDSLLNGSQQTLNNASTGLSIIGN